MIEKGLLSVGEFAKLSRTTTATLHHYEKLGLLLPVQRGGNRYRYYSTRQLGLFNVIRTMQEMGVKLVDIKALSEQRTPVVTDAMLRRQIEKIEGEINKWVSARKLLFTLQQCIESVLEVDEDAITIQFMPEMSIILGDMNDYSGGNNAYDALIRFYQTMRSKYPKLDLNYPVWGLFSDKQLKAGEFTMPERYYFYNPEGHDRRAAALYAVGYTRGTYGEAAPLYARMLDYIDKNGFEVCGEAYEEYPLNEVCIPDEDNYLIRVLITVCEKE